MNHRRQVVEQRKRFVLISMMALSILACQMGGSP